MAKEKKDDLSLKRKTEVWEVKRVAEAMTSDRGYTTLVPDSEFFFSQNVLTRVKWLLDAKGKNIEWLANEIGLKTKASLYTGFKRGTITFSQIFFISQVLGVEPYFFFAPEVIGLMTDEVSKSKKNPDLKGFLLSLNKRLHTELNIKGAVKKSLSESGN